MSVFKVAKFEDNKVSDAACKELFSTKFKSHKKNSKKQIKSNVQNGKIRKNIKNKKNKIEKPKITGIKNLLSELQNAKTITYNDRSTKTKGLFKKHKNQKKGDNPNEINTKNVKKASNKKHTPEKINKIDEDYRQRKKLSDITKKHDKIKHRLEKKKLKRKLKKMKLKEEMNKKLQQTEQPNEHSTTDDVNEVKLDYKQKKREKIKQKILQTVVNTTNSSTPKVTKKNNSTKSLRERMLEKLQAARFRYINEQIYSNDSKGTQKYFTKDPEAFEAYHEGYKQQVSKWPINPLDVIIKSVQKLPKTYVVADFGCGDARLATSVEHKVHSFDLLSKNKLVTACDMAHVPLQKNSVDVVVFCLSLMGTNLSDYLLEANRVLKEGGILKIAEVESRFQDVNCFIQDLKKYHFTLTWKDLSHNLFYFLDFKKDFNIKNKKKLPKISLNPCLYKKR